MELESLWEMLKADKYSDEGKKVIEEGLTEDKVYKVGEISQKTGLQKQPDGSWAEPKRAKRNAKLYPSLQPLVRQREPFMKKRIEAFTKLRDNPGNPKAKADFVDATINQIDADIDRAYKKATSDNPYEITESFMKEAMKDPKTRLSQKYDAVKNAKKGSPEYDKAMSEAMSEYLKERDVFKQDQGAEAVKEFPITPDCAPRVLTGDCKIRVKR